MPDGRPPGPICLSRSDDCAIDSGTLCRQPSPTPGAILLETGAAVLASPPATSSTSDDSAVRESVSVGAAISDQLTWDGFVREHVYNPAAEAIGRQGHRFVQTGQMTATEAAEWVNAQRNALVVAIRDGRNSPLGRAYSEFLKPRDRLPTVPQLIERHMVAHPGSTAEQAVEAVIESAGRTRASVNRLSLVLRWAGPAAIAVDVGFSAYLIVRAPEAGRGLVAARQVGGTVGSFIFGWAGAEAGCAAGGAIGAWAFGVGAGPGCLIGGAIASLGLGGLGYTWGREAGEVYYPAAQSVLRWVTP